MKTSILRLKVGDQEQGIAAVIAITIILGICFTVISSYLVVWIPREGYQQEAAHMDEVRDSFLELKSSVELLELLRSKSVSVKMNADPIPLFGGAGVGGRLSIRGDNDLEIVKEYRYVSSWAAVKGTILDPENQQADDHHYTKFEEELFPAAMLNLSIPPTDDTYVDEANPDLNYQGENLEVRTQQKNKNKRSFLKFELPEVLSEVTIENVKLKLYCQELNRLEAYPHTDVQCRGVDNDNWDENTLTWDNQPQARESSLWTVRLTDTGIGWQSWDVTEFVENEIENDHIASFCMRMVTEDHDAVHRYALFSSRECENSDRTPYLEIIGSAENRELEIYENVDDVPSSGENYYLELRYFRSGDDLFRLYVWDGDNWNFRAELGSTSPTEVVLLLEKDEVLGGVVQVKLVDASPIPFLPASLYDGILEIDYLRVRCDRVVSSKYGYVRFDINNRYYPSQNWIYETGGVILLQEGKSLMISPLGEIGLLGVFENDIYGNPLPGENLRVEANFIKIKGFSGSWGGVGTCSLSLGMRSSSYIVENRACENVLIEISSPFIGAWGEYLTYQQDQLNEMGYNAIFDGITLTILGKNTDLGIQDIFYYERIVEIEIDLG